MNILLSNIQYIIGGVVLGLIILIAIILLITKKRPKRRTKINVEVEVLEKIYLALGENNIVSVDREQDRVRLILNDPKLVNAKVLTELKIPAFLKGKEVKLLFKDNSEQLYTYLNEKINN
mgnify:CR=1 FL=1